MKPIIVKNDDFNTVVLKLYYPVDLNVENDANRLLLSNMLTMTSKAYPTVAEFERAIMENSIIGLSSHVVYFKDQNYLMFKLCIPDEKHYGEDILEPTLNFLADVIYNPNVKDGCFDEKLISKEKNLCKMNLKRQHNDINISTRNRFLEEVDSLGLLTRGLYFNEHLIDKTDEKKVYEYYKEVLENKAPIVFAFGNFDECKLQEILDKYFYIGGRDINPYDNSKVCYLPLKHDENIIKEVKPFSQTVLHMGYIAVDMQESDEIILAVINDLLNDEASFLLHKKLRDEHKLVYFAGSMAWEDSGLLGIVARLNKESIAEAIDVIKETMVLLGDEDFINPLLTQLKDKRRIGLEYQKDSKYSILGDQICKYMGFGKTDIEIYEEYSKVSAKDIKEFLPRLKLDTIYCMEGSKDE